jgi:ferredoxin-NADP reductase/MOSC domain-containing protein YiiM
MRVLSVNVGLPRDVIWKGEQVRTGIFKEPVDGPVRIRTLNLEGDRQADLKAHGGWEKAVYAYPSEFYELWRKERPELDFAWAKFGENLTTEGLLDGDVNVGDCFRVGTAVLIVTEPRLPCFRLGIRMGRDEFVAEFLERGLLGFYLAVVQEGEVQAGDPIVEVSRDPHGFKVTEITRLYARDREDVDGLRRAVELDVVPESWRNYFRKRLADLERKRAARLLPAPAPPAWADFRPFEVREKVRESEDVVSLYLRPSDGEPLPAYKPGQYLTLRMPMPNGGSPPIRSYSLSDSPKEDAYRVTVKRIAEGVADANGGLVSTFLHDHVRVGDVLDVKAPAGQFTIDPAENYRPVVLIGAGIGITPILAMLNSIVEHRRQRETWVFYGVRDHRDHVAQRHLEELAVRHPFIRLHVCYSQPVVENGNALGNFHHAGRITVELLQELLPASYYDYYLCGPGAMMQSLAEGLRAWGVPGDRIHSEAFGPAAIKAATEPESRRDVSLQVTFARSELSTVWTRADSPLLELAEDSGVSIPFGCRAGSCGTCVTKLVSGDVSYLHEPGAPLAEGEVLTCVAVPETEVVLDV